MKNKLYKLLTIFLLIPTLLLLGCEKNTNELKEIKIDQSTLSDKYYYEDFDIASINLLLVYENETKKIPISNDMLNISDLSKLNTIGTHNILINYQGLTTNLSLTLTDYVHIKFVIDGSIFYEYDLLRGSDLEDIPDMPYIENYVGKWLLNNKSNIQNDLNIKGIYINTLANTVEEVVNYLDSYFENIVINENIRLDEYIGNCKITWSSNSQYLNDKGVFDRPYQDEMIVLNANITDGEITTNVSYDIKLHGYRDINEKIASGYVYRNYIGLTNNFYETMDIIYCAFMLIDTEAGFTNKDAQGTNIEVTNASTIAKMKNYVVPKARKKGSYVIASLGGGGDAPTATFSIIAASAELRKKFAENVVKLINECDLDGVDVDWETPKRYEIGNFTLLMEEIYKAVKANNPNHLVTAAIGGGSQGSLYDLYNSGKYLDYINVMTYSFSSSDGNYQNALYHRSDFHNTTYNVGKAKASIDNSVQYLVNSNIPREKLIIGVAFYGKKQLSSNGRWKAFASIDYDQIVLGLKQNLYNYYYDEVAQVPYLISKNGNEFISYDNAISIKAKCDYVINNHLAGVMFWETGGDTSDELILAMQEKLK